VKIASVRNRRDVTIIMMSYKWDPTCIENGEDDENTPADVCNSGRGHFNYGEDTPAGRRLASSDIYLFQTYIQLKKLEIAEPRARMRVVLI
jgi:hypothetical protein